MFDAILTAIYETILSGIANVFGGKPETPEDSVKKTIRNIE